MESYEQVVSRCYESLHEPFCNLIRSRFSGLQFAEIEDIYQDTFLAVHDNLRRGAVAEDTNWHGYIMRIGINQALTHMRRNGRFVAERPDADEGDTGAGWLERMGTLAEMVDNRTNDAAERERMIDVMNGAIGSLTGKCKELLPAFYYAGLTMEQICEELGYSSTDSAKTQRYKCFGKLKAAVRAQLAMMGLEP